MARAARVSEASVRRVWRAHGLKPHRVETFKVSNDPHFAEQLDDVVGLYLNPPEQAIVLSVDERARFRRCGCLAAHEEGTRSNHDA
jgi:hypothetical protein